MDRRPIPLPIFEQCRCSATVFVRTAGGGLTPRLQTTFVTDVYGTGAPRDTCPVSSRLDIEWHAEPHAATGYRYRLAVGPVNGFPPQNFIEVGPNVKSAAYDSLPYPPLIEVFTLGVRGPAGTYTDSTRRFKVNYPPDSWWAGPDRDSPSLMTKPNGERYTLLAGDGHLASGIVGSLLSDDSTQVLPALRPERLTFFEIWKDTVYARQEGDTVHLNSWVIFHGGGFDSDSRYAVRVSDEAHQYPGFPGGPVYEPGPANGSAAGMRFTARVALDQGYVVAYPKTQLLPMFEAGYVPALNIGAYSGAVYAGRFFSVAIAEDGNGSQDLRAASNGGIDLVQRVENGTATPEEQALRSKVLTFYVDRPPYFLAGDELFRPTPSQRFTTPQWTLNLIAADDDPRSFLDRRVGGPTGSVTLRRTIKVLGKDLQGNDLTYVDPNVYLNQQNITVNVPANLRPGSCEIEVELCDCDQCEAIPGSGRCVVSQFPVVYAPPASPNTVVAAASPAGGPAPAGGLPAPAIAPRTLLFAPHANPASRGVTIRWSLAEAGDIDLELFNVAGQRVRRLASEPAPAGEHSRIWDGLDDAGRPVAAGLYFIRLRAPGATLMRKIFVAR